MRKTQIALAAVALVASSAALANGVTVSGSLDAGIASQNSAIGGAKTTNFVEGNWNGGSHMTFAGSEDLGGGLKEGFTLQTGFSMKDGQRRHSSNDRSYHCDTAERIQPSSQCIAGW